MRQRALNVTVMVIRWLSANWSGVTDAYVRPPGALCADCSSAAGRITLLTAWTAYYTCSVCHRRWSRTRHGKEHTDVTLPRSRDVTAGALQSRSSQARNA